MNKIITLIISSLFLVILLQTASAATITLGSGVNITNGTIIRLTGANCNITMGNTHIVDKLEVYSTYTLINSSLAAPTYILNLPYNYSTATTTINITNRSNIAANLTVNTSTFGDGVKIYSISSPSYLTSVSWSSPTLTLIVNGSTGADSITEVFWPYSAAPTASCTGCSASANSFVSGTNIATLTATHSSPVTWTLTTSSGDGGTTPIQSDTGRSSGYTAEEVIEEDITEPEAEEVIEEVPTEEVPTEEKPLTEKIEAQVETIKKTVYVVPFPVWALILVISIVVIIYRMYKKNKY